MKKKLARLGPDLRVRTRNSTVIMKKKKSSSPQASAARTTIAISLFSIASLLLASGFANALAGRRGDNSVAQPAVTCTVTSTADSGPGALRDCLAGSADTIDATGVSGTILLTSGELAVTHGVTINGPGSASLTVNGNAISRVFHIFAGVSASISGLTVTNGFASGPFPANQAGGIWNDHAILTLTNSTVTANSSAGGKGGGVVNDAFDHGSASLVIDSCTISNNSALCAGGFCPNGGGISNIGFGTPIPATVTITNSIITGNSAGFAGGAIDNSGIATVSNSTLSGNTAGAHGGAIYSAAPLTVTNCTLSSNSAFSGQGGGIFSEAAGAPTITNSTISGNSSMQSGGGIMSLARNPGPLTVSNSTISGNSYSQSDQGGGGIANFGDAIVSNSTISGNSGPNVGGGIVNLSFSLTVTNCTFSGNSASGNNGNGGGAIFNWTGGTTQIGDTVLNAGAAGGTLFNNSGAITSLGYNLASDNGGGFLTASGDQINTNPILGPLQDNGGPTFTQALLPGSPAIDTGDPNFMPPPDFDQRGAGFPRVVDGRIDIGAFEVQGITLSGAGRKVAGINTVRLTWSGANSIRIDIYRNAVVVATVRNRGTYADSTGDTGRAKYTYQVCEAGTQICSNQVTVTFRQ